VIHFAASKAVGESVENPLLYYENNINALVYILQELQQKRSSKFYFSSSCTVYGQAETMPITENAIQIAMSPYGNTKQMGRDYHRYGQSPISTLFCCVISINWVTSIS
jgi:UDP-glucose 4-epimerase